MSRLLTTLLSVVALTTIATCLPVRERSDLQTDVKTTMFGRGSMQDAPQTFPPTGCYNVNYEYYSGFKILTEGATCTVYKDNNCSQYHDSTQSELYWDSKAKTIACKMK
ncbi:hypothetical protein DFQ27_008984 [Actinomortierella ambigua]|uniref:Uncharacterized protein n=1 Tax=Actinomortierella ambigua TaxID=1343610 RepID=A0A9P6UAY1_9FUNG|nr:hypothetical protein DFQ27_008984 [Actinomortierella ambigua]